MSETNRIEYKSKLTDNLEKEVVAFLNYPGGGVIYFGIGKDAKVLGITDLDQVQLLIKDRLRNNIIPSCLGLFDIVAEKRDGQNIIKLIVASGSERPYYIKKYGLSEKGTFIRSGSAAEPMPSRMIETLFAKRTRNSIGKIKSPRGDLRFEQLRIYYDSTGKTLNEQFAKNLELLNDDENYNMVAFILSDNNTISVKTAKYSGLDRVDLIENNEHGFCSIIKATKAVLDKVDIENKTLTRITSRERQDKRRWNPIALREAIINAIVHNDYTRELGPKFEIFEDRIEITSNGGLPDPLSTEEFFIGVSIPRNKELMRIYRDLEMVEQLGSGVPRILQSYGQDCFVFSENFIRMIFPIDKELMTNEGLNEGLYEGLNEGLKSLLIAIGKNEGIRAKQLSTLLANRSIKTLDRQISILVKKGLIERRGSRKTGGYFILAVEAPNIDDD